MPAFMIKGRVRTLDADQDLDVSVPRHIAIVKDKIVHVGDEHTCIDALKRESGDSDLAGMEIIEVPEKGIVMPAFHDSHIHPCAGGLQVIQCNLRSCATLDDALATITAYAASMRASRPSNTDGESKQDVRWVVGGGWQPEWFENGTPTSALLDSVCPDFPAYLRDTNGHEGWTNTAGLKAAKIDEKTPDPPAGFIVRDQQGAPVGHMLMGACRLLVRAMPPLADSMRDKGLAAAIHQATSAGISSVHDALVNEDVWKVFLRADAEKRLPIMVHMALEWVASLSFSENLESLKAKRQYAREHGKMLRAETVKIFVDGIPENQTAFMLRPYKQNPNAKRKPAMLSQVRNAAQIRHQSAAVDAASAEHKAAVGLAEPQGDAGGESGDCCAGKGKGAGGGVQYAEGWRGSPIYEQETLKEMIKVWFDPTLNDALPSAWSLVKRDAHARSSEHKSEHPM